MLGRIQLGHSHDAVVGRHRVPLVEYSSPSLSAGSQLCKIKIEKTRRKNKKKKKEEKKLSKGSKVQRHGCTS
jgi:hypothetical protein